MVRVLALALLFLPTAAFASVVVVDVVYDVPGADTRREWVEFFTDATIDDIRTWRFLEGGVRHKITSEGGVVPANSRFVLASDVPSFRADNPEYVGLVFDTAMSLSNSGESFSLLTASGTVMLAHTYTPAPKPEPVTETVHVVEKPEPRVLGAQTSTLEERSKQVAAAVEATSSEWAWFSFAFLGLIMLGGLFALAYVQFKK